MTEADLTARLEKLERDNLRIKRLGMIAVVIAAALGAMYTASCSPAGRRSGTQDGLDKITAREFDMLDASGKVRAKIAMDCSVPKDCWPIIDLYDREGKALTVIGAGTSNISGKKSSTTPLDNGIQVEGRSRGEGLGDIATLELVWSAMALP